MKKHSCLLYKLIKDYYGEGLDEEVYVNEYDSLGKLYKDIKEKGMYVGSRAKFYREKDKNISGKYLIYDNVVL